MDPLLWHLAKHSLSRQLLMKLVPPKLSNSLKNMLPHAQPLRNHAYHVLRFSSFSIFRGNVPEIVGANKRVPPRMARPPKPFGDAKARGYPQRKQNARTPQIPRLRCCSQNSAQQKRKHHRLQQRDPKIRHNKTIRRQQTNHIQPMGLASIPRSSLHAPPRKISRPLPKALPTRCAATPFANVACVEEPHSFLVLFAALLFSRSIFCFPHQNALPSFWGPQTQRNTRAAWDSSS